MPTDLDICRAITSTRFLNVRCLSKNYSQEYNIICFLYSCRSNFNISYML